MAFDVDGCLIDENDEPRPEVIRILLALAPWAQIVVWSGGGLGYAKRRGRQLGLPPGIVYWSKSRMPNSVDIAFDDQEVNLGIVNIKVADLPVGDRLAPAGPVLAEEEADAAAQE